MTENKIKIKLPNFNTYNINSNFLILQAAINHLLFSRFFKLSMIKLSIIILTDANKEIVMKNISFYNKCFMKLMCFY